MGDKVRLGDISIFGIAVAICCFKCQTLGRKHQTILVESIHDLSSTVPKTKCQHSSPMGKRMWQRHSPWIVAMLMDVLAHAHSYQWSRSTHTAWNRMLDISESNGKIK